MADETSVIPEGGIITVFTDGSSEPSGTGARIFLNGLSEKLSNKENPLYNVQILITQQDWRW